MIKTFTEFSWTNSYSENANPSDFAKEASFQPPEHHVTTSKMRVTCPSKGAQIGLKGSFAIVSLSNEQLLGLVLPQWVNPISLSVSRWPMRDSGKMLTLREKYVYIKNRTGWRAYFWNIVFGAWWYYFAKNRTALPCENGNDFSRFEKDVSLIGWVRNPTFSRMKNVAKITPAQIIICCQHGIIEAHSLWETFLQMILNKIKMVEKECKRSIFSSRIISGIWWLNEIKRLTLWSKIGLWCCKTIKHLKNNNPLK